MRTNWMLTLLLSAALAASAAGVTNDNDAEEQALIQDLQQAFTTQGADRAEALVTAWDGQPDTPAKARLIGHAGLAAYYADNGNTVQAIRQYETAADLAHQLKEEVVAAAIEHQLVGLKEIGQALPQVLGMSLDGREVDTAALQGKVVLVQFFASWCGPCRAEAPEIQELSKKYADGLQIVGVSLDDNTDDLRTYLAAQPMSWPILADFQGWDASLAKQFGVTSIPDSILVDQQGRILRRGLRAEELDQAIGKLLAK